MNQQSKQEKYTQADLQIRNLLLEREEMRQRFNVQTQLLTYLVKLYGGEDEKIRMSLTEVNKLDMEVEGVKLATVEVSGDFVVLAARETATESRWRRRVRLWRKRDSRRCSY